MRRVRSGYRRYRKRNSINLKIVNTYEYRRQRTLNLFSKIGALWPSATHTQTNGFLTKPPQTQPKANCISLSPRPIPKLKRYKFTIHIQDTILFALHWQV